MPRAKGKSGGKRPGAGRSTFKPTEEQRTLVEQLSAFGIGVDKIPVFVMSSIGQPISEPMLKKYFKKEIEHGRLKANFKVANALYKNATDGSNVTAQIWWLKVQAGWRETHSVELTGKDGAPIKTQDVTEGMDGFYAKLAAMRDAK
ncbi:MAG TPA: hypothetical protein ACQGQH_10450 [Xylella sp.]